MFSNVTFKLSDNSPLYLDINSFMLNTNLDFTSSSVTGDDVGVVAVCLALVTDCLATVADPPKAETIAAAI